MFELAWAHSQVEHRHSDRFGESAHLFQRLASHIIFAGSALRADRPVLAGNRLGQEGLWRFGISGDRPIVLARFQNADQLRLAQELIAAQSISPHQGARVRPRLARAKSRADTRKSFARSFWVSFAPTAAPTGSTSRAACSCDTVAVMREDERILLQAAARVVLVGDRGSLASQLDRTEWRHPLPAALAALARSRQAGR